MEFTGDFGSSYSNYMQHISRQPLALLTKRAYLARVRVYLKWLENSIDGEKALSNSIERDFQIRDFRNHLLQSGAKPASINSMLAALDSFNVFLGLGPAKIKRQDLPASAPKALSGEELRRLMKAIAHCTNLRNKTVAMLLLHSGLRLSELTELNVGDVFVTARKGEIVVRNGKGNKHRRIPLNADLRQALQEFMSSPRDPSEPLFKSQRGCRLSTSSVDHAIKQIARDAGIEMSCHTLRHCCLTSLIRSGSDIVLVAEIAGHSRLETTRRYSLPTQDDKIQAMERLNFGF